MLTKQLMSIVLALSVLLLMSCQQTSVAATTAPTSATSYWLMVINGTGGGHFPTGSTVHIWANPHPKGTTFDVWEGQTQPLPDIYCMHATITMPAHEVEIEATYTEIPA